MVLYKRDLKQTRTLNESPLNPIRRTKCSRTLSNPSRVIRFSVTSVLCICLIGASSGCTIPWIHKGSGITCNFSVCQRAASQETAKYSNAWENTAPINCDINENGVTKPIEDYVILEEIIWYRDIFESFKYTRFVRGEMSTPENGSFDVRVPILLNAYFGILNICQTDGYEYRITVFSPGHAVTTVYPVLGYNPMHNYNLNEAWREPRLLTIAYPSNGFGFHTGADERLEYIQQENETISSTIPMWELPLPTTKSKDRRVFVVQMKSLAAAIVRGQLQSVEPEARQLVLDTVRREYEYWKQAIIEEYEDETYARKTLIEFQGFVDPQLVAVNEWAGAE